MMQDNLSMPVSAASSAVSTARLGPLVPVPADITACEIIFKASSRITHFEDAEPMSTPIYKVFSLICTLTTNWLFKQSAMIRTPIA
jgi:hypothetical protein